MIGGQQFAASTGGHAAGDVLLRLVAERIGHRLHGEDTLARLGGDEFAVLLGEGRATGEQATDVAQWIISAVSAPYVLDGHEAVIGVSIGITLCARGDGKGATPALLLRQADMALYQAKVTGRGTCCVFKIALMSVV